MLTPTGYPPPQHSSRHRPQHTQHTASTAATSRCPQGGVVLVHLFIANCRFVLPPRCLPHLLTMTRIPLFPSLPLPSAGPVHLRPGALFLPAKEHIFSFSHNFDFVSPHPLPHPPHPYPPHPLPILRSLTPSSRRAPFG